MLGLFCFVFASCLVGRSQFFVFWLDRPGRRFSFIVPTGVCIPLLPAVPIVVFIILVIVIVLGVPAFPSFFAVIALGKGIA